MTVSVPKYWRAIAIVAAVSLLVMFISQTIDSRPTKLVRYGDTKILAEVASSNATRARGLSGRARLAENHGMLFVFEDAGKHCFWMKDMKFNIDMVWLDQNKNVIKLIPNVSPQTYPQTFCPNEPANYVLELGAGVARQTGLGEGKQVLF